MFRRVTTAYAVNELGNWLGAVALAVAVFDRTHSPIAMAGLFVSMRFLPALVAPAVVARLELVGSRRTLSALYCFQALTTAALAVMVAHVGLAPVLLIGGIDGTSGLSARALLRAAVAQEARDEGSRRRANARLNVVWSANAALGPALAGVLTGMIGASGTLGLDAVSFLIAAPLMLGVAPSRTDVMATRLREQLSGIWHHVAGKRALRTLLTTEAAALVFFAAVVPIEVVFAKATLHAGDSGYGAMLAAWGVGMFAGSAIFARSHHRALGGLLTVSTLAVGVAYMGTAVAPALWVACTASVVGGIGNGVQWISLITFVQQQTPETLQGRVMGVVESIGAICPSIGFALGGAIAAITSPRATFAVAGAVAALSTVVFARMARPNAPPAHGARPVVGYGAS